MCEDFATCPEGSCSACRKGRVSAFPASFIAGVLWQGVGKWQGFGPSAPFFFGAALAILAVALLVFWMPRARSGEA